MCKSEKRLGHQETNDSSGGFFISEVKERERSLRSTVEWYAPDLSTFEKRSKDSIFRDEAELNNN